MQFEHELERNLETYVPPTTTIGDLGSGFYQEQAEIDGGRMDKFVAFGGAGALPLGYYDATPMAVGQLAKQYTLDDHFSMPRSARRC
jgi:phospholipase C